MQISEENAQDPPLYLHAHSIQLDSSYVWDTSVIYLHLLFVAFVYMPTLSSWINLTSIMAQKDVFIT